MIANFIAQAGGYDEKYAEKPARARIPNESGNGLSNRRGTVGLARTATRTAATRSSTSTCGQRRARSQPSRWGYTVFGRVVEGMNVVDDIGAVATGEVGPFKKDAPLKPVIVIRIEELK